MTINSRRTSVPSFISLSHSMPLHPFHMTSASPWPIMASAAVLAILSSAVMWFNHVDHGGTLLLLGIASVFSAAGLWFKDVVTEGTHLGLHTRIVQQCLSMGVSLFIVTEAMLFVSVFWAYFHSSLSPTVELGVSWPPVGLVPLSPITVPLLNTLLLVSSGATVTYGHHAMFQGARGPALVGMLLTVVLAIIFTTFQYLEYDVAGFSISDGAFGSAFYFSTGLHGMHVAVGTMFLTAALVRLASYHFTQSHHLGLESAILYWHFVDIVWLFLYLAVYWWGSE
jgi:cytochrome c oxidase subunit 3